MRTKKPTGKALGGVARAEKLSKEERREIAQKAANARWGDKIQIAPFVGTLSIGETEIPCAVLEDGTRLISERGVTKALGGKRGGSHWKRMQSDGGANLPVYLSANNIKPFIDEELAVALNNRIEYRTSKGGGVSYGLEASLLPQVCDVWLKARDAGQTLKSQEKMALAADMLMRSLAKVGIVALVDEATGYQAQRDRDELQKLLAIYLSEEKLKWAKMFPDEYYRQLFRLWGWNYSPVSVKRPGYVGKLTNELVYEKLPPTVLEELRKRNPVKNKKTGRRSAAHFQFLSADIGQPDLRDHLLQLIAVMRVSKNKNDFKKNFKIAFPVPGDQLDMFEDDSE